MIRYIYAGWCIHGTLTEVILRNSIIIYMTSVYVNWLVHVYDLMYDHGVG